MDFSIEQPIESQIESRDVELFKGQVDLLSRIVIDQLELKEFTRIGLRAWYLFRGQDKPEAETWLRNLGLYTISGNLETAFGGKIESVGMSVVLAGEDRKFRIAMNGVERGAQVDRGAEVIVIRSSSLSKNQDKYFKEQLRRKGSLRAMPEFASMIDVDAFQDDPISIDPRDFIETSLDQFMDRLWKAIPHP